ncbi:MAG: GNAT family N-acetyltransferase, partial [Gaiellales bacterium]
SVGGGSVNWHTLNAPSGAPPTLGPRAKVAHIPEFAVRTVRPDEHTALGELTVAAYRAVPGETISPGYEETLRDVVARSDEADVLVAVGAAGTLLGGVTYVGGAGKYAEFEGVDEAGIRMLAVSPAAQCGGIGRRLVQEGIDRATVAGKARIVLHTTEAMVAAQSLYGSFGFDRTPGRDLMATPSMRLIAYVLELKPAR